MKLNSNTYQNILLVPPLPNLHFQEQSDNFMPLGLFVLAAILKNNNFEFSIFKPEKQLTNDNDYKEVAKDILSKESSIIGFSTWCVSYATSLLLAKNLKELDPSITILFGGPHASLTAEETLINYPSVDYILKGEADESLPIFLDVFFNRKIKNYSIVPGLVYFDSRSKKIIYSESPLVIPDITRGPRPLYELAETKTIKLDVGRGCPFHCTYCSTSDFFSKKFRIKSVDQIIGEMDYCYKTMGTTSFGFSHDNFTCNNGFILEFSNALQKYCNEHQVEFKWTCSSRPDTVNKEMLTSMKNAGCTKIFFGIESGSLEIQKSIKKKLNLKKVLEVAAICKEVKIQMNASFMAGFPGETFKDIDDSLKLMIKLIGIGARVQLSLLSVLPGTMLFKKYIEKLNLDGRFSDFSAYRPTELEYKMIKNEKALFSSFYYYPNSVLKRDHLFSLSRLVNDLREFHKTAEVISGEILNSVNGQEIFQNLMAGLESYRKENPKSTELFFLIDQLSNLIQHLDKDKLPASMEDALIAETAMAVVKRKFLVYRVSEIFRAIDKNSNKRQNIKNLFVLPQWTVFKTQNDISSMFNVDRKSFMQSCEENQNGYFFLVSATNERQSRLYCITESQYELSKNLKAETLDEILTINRHIMPKESIINLLDKYQKFRLISYES